MLYFARRLAEGLDYNRKFSMRVERERMACTLLGSCYSDMMRYCRLYAYSEQYAENDFMSVALKSYM